MAEPLLEVSNLRKLFPVRSGGAVRRTVGHVQAVDGISFTVDRGETLGLVGESGCGKTTTARLVSRLLEPTSGSIRLGGTEIGRLDRRSMLPYRRRLQLVFQDPYSSLNPRQTVGTIVGTPLKAHRLLPPDEVGGRVSELLELVGLAADDRHRHPGELSGGQRQRVAIARALAVGPDLLVADEPVSALDVSIQAQVLNLLADLQRDLGVAYLLISHDLAVVRQFCPRVAVMYLGKIVETADRETLYGAPQHPYTQALLSAVPGARGPVRPRARRTRLVGETPRAVDPPSGCRFRTRCWRAQDVCAIEEPPLVEIERGQHVACHFPGTEGSRPALGS